MGIVVEVAPSTSFSSVLAPEYPLEPLPFGAETDWPRLTLFHDVRALEFSIGQGRQTETFGVGTRMAKHRRACP